MVAVMHGGEHKNVPHCGTHALRVPAANLHCEALHCYTRTGYRAPLLPTVLIHADGEGGIGDEGAAHQPGVRRLRAWGLRVKHSAGERVLYYLNSHVSAALKGGR